MSAGEDGFIKIWEQVKGICIKVIDFLKYDLNNLFFLHENLFLILYDLKNVILCMLKKNLDHHTIGIKKKIQIKKPENLSVFSKFEFLINYQKKKIELAYIDKKSFLNKLENKEIARKNLENCEEVLTKIENKEYKVKDIKEIVKHYNKKCSNNKIK